MVLVDAHLDHRRNFGFSPTKVGAGPAGPVAGLPPGVTNKSVASVVSLRGMRAPAAAAASPSPWQCAEAAAAVHPAVMATDLFGDAGEPAVWWHPSAAAPLAAGTDQLAGLQVHSAVGGVGQPTLVSVADDPAPWLVAAGGDGQELPSASVLSNSQSVVRPLEALTGRAAAMLQSGAYLHHYQRFGVEAADFLDQLVVLEQILFDYRSL